MYAVISNPVKSLRSNLSIPQYFFFHPYIEKYKSIVKSFTCSMPLPFVIVSVTATIPILYVFISFRILCVWSSFHLHSRFQYSMSFFVLEFLAISLKPELGGLVNFSSRLSSHRLTDFSSLRDKSSLS